MVVDENSSRDRFALVHEDIKTNDTSYYENHLVRVVESVLSPLGWYRTRIGQKLAETKEIDLMEFLPVSDEWSTTK